MVSRMLNLPLWMTLIIFAGLRGADLDSRRAGGDCTGPCGRCNISAQSSDTRA